MQAAERVCPEVGQARGTLVGIGQEPGHHGIILEGAGQGCADRLQIGNRVCAADLVCRSQGDGFALHDSSHSTRPTRSAPASESLPSALAGIRTEVLESCRRRRSVIS